MAQEGRDIFRDAIAGLLRPVIRFAVNRSFRIQDLLEITKVVFLDVAEEEISRAGHEVSVSRLSVVTGIHRRDVMRLWRDEKEPKADSDLVMRILGQWQGDKRFSSKGKPKVLTILGTGGDFRELVFSVSRDLNPYTVLFELERAGAVRVNESQVELVSKALRISGDAKKGLQLLAHDSSDLVSAVTENIFQEQDQLNLHIRTEFDNIPVKYEQPIRAWFLAEGAKLHERAQDYLARFDLDTSGRKEEAGEATLRAVIGSFGFTETKK